MASGLLGKAAMTDLTVSFTSPSVLSWDGEGRRVSGGPLAPDPPATEGRDALTFSDLLSVLNPLQHIPVVSSIYRWVTGDTITPVARVVGGALYGGPIGLASAAFNTIVEQVKGADVGAQVLALFDGDKPAEGETAPKLAAARASENAPAPAASEAPVSTGAEALAQLAADLRGVRERPATTEAVTAATPETAPASGQGRGIGYYLANAGRRLPATDLSTSRVVHTPPVPPTVQKPAPIAAQFADEARKEAGASVPPDGPPAQWFNAAMMRGLDRYRAMQRGEAAPQVDLSH